MWPIPIIQDELVLISFSVDSIACSWIQQKTKGSPLLLLCAYERYQLTNLELANLTLFNPTIVRNHISVFLEKYDKKDAFIAFCLDGPGVIERFVALPTSAPARSDFEIAYSSSTIWDYYYMYHNDRGQFVFYLSIMARSLLLQYQLLAVSAQCNIIAITTKTMALFSAYKNIFGIAFRRTQLAIDMMRCNNQIEKLISAEILKRMIIVPTDVVLRDELPYIAMACGLFCAERMNK